MKRENSNNGAPKKLGILVGGSGLIGGYLTYYFKTRTPDIELRAPNSKKLSLRSPGDIKEYFRKHKPDFVINAAIAAIDSDAQMAYEVNYLGSIYLARAAMALGIPYIHFSSAATLPPGDALTEDDHLPLSPELSNYAKSKLMAEITLRHMYENLGLDYTSIRMAVVYGAHDHKIQGLQRLLYSIIDKSMPFMLTKKGVRHSYSNANKLPYFVHHILGHREEFSGRIYNFVDPEPVELGKLILTIKSYMELNTPKEIYIPYPVARLAKGAMETLIRILGRVGVKSRIPAELIFLEHFYKSQTLSSERLNGSSFTDPFPQATIFTELPMLIDYYLARWEHLNLFTSYTSNDFACPKNLSSDFASSPRSILEATHREAIEPFNDIV